MMIVEPAGLEIPFILKMIFQMSGPLEMECGTLIGTDNQNNYMIVDRMDIAFQMLIKIHAVLMVAWQLISTGMQQLMKMEILSLL